MNGTTVSVSCSGAHHSGAYHGSAYVPRLHAGVFLHLDWGLETHTCLLKLLRTTSPLGHAVWYVSRCRVSCIVSLSSDHRQSRASSGLGYKLTGYGGEGDGGRTDLMAGHSITGTHTV